MWPTQKRYDAKKKKAVNSILCNVHTGMLCPSPVVRAASTSSSYHLMYYVSILFTVGSCAWQGLPRSLLYTPGRSRQEGKLLADHA
mmetsp:Transcript_5263/g.5158  ORF Transcript_5263/g.5158 Transcript_5263/m.5158 type:complete len:86 (+) Transcript_5263:86-343(+)